MKKNSTLFWVHSSCNTTSLAPSIRYMQRGKSFAAAHFIWVPCGCDIMTPPLQGMSIIRHEGASVITAASHSKLGDEVVSTNNGEAVRDTLAPLSSRSWTRPTPLARHQLSAPICHPSGLEPVRNAAVGRQLLRAGSELVGRVSAVSPVQCMGEEGVMRQLRLDFFPSSRRRGMSRLY
jgi:hypothetical protein